MEYVIFKDHVRAMFGPCRDHILTSFTSKPVRPLQSSRLSQQGPRAYVRAMFGPCKTMFRLALLPDQPELWNFQDWVNMVCGPCLWSVYFFRLCQDHIWTMMGPCLDYCHFQTSYISKRFKTVSTWSEALVYGVLTFWDHVKTMFWPS